MVAIGAMHFIKPAGFVAIVPAWLPAPALLVYLSGVAEIAGGLGLLSPWDRVRRAAAVGLVVLYIAVFPANVNQAIHHLPFDGKPVPEVVLWARLPFQAVFIGLAWWLALHETRRV